MVNEYSVKAVMQPGGIMYAVIYRGMYRFLQRDKKRAKTMADKLNNIRQRKMEQA